MKTFVVEFTITQYVKIGNYWESCDIGFQEYYQARTERGARCLVLVDYLNPNRTDHVEEIKFNRVSALDY